MLIPALLGGVDLPVDGGDFLLNGLHQVVVAPNALPGEDSQLPVLHVAHPPGVAQDGGDVAGDEVAPLPVAQNEGAVLADRHDLAGAVGAQDAQGVGPLDAAERPAHGGQQIPLVKILDELGHYLGVGFRGEGHPLGHEKGLQLGVVFDDAVVDHGDPSAAAHLGVGVDVTGSAVGGPAGVPHAHGAVQVCPAVELVGQHLKPPLGLVDGQGARLNVEHRHPGGVVPTILQPGQPFQQNGSGLFPSDVAYNSAHI